VARIAKSYSDTKLKIIAAYYEGQRQKDWRQSTPQANEPTGNSSKQRWCRLGFRRLLLGAYHISGTGPVVISSGGYAVAFLTTLHD
jgi:hypothetical protein